jgi:hypothetical protein
MLSKRSAWVVAGICGAMAVTSLSGGLFSPASAAASQPLSPTGPGTLFDRVVPLAGSATLLVYARTHQLAGGAGGLDGAQGRDDSYTAALEARTSTGATTSLGHYPADFMDWSLAGDMLTAVPSDDAGENPQSQVVSWWNVSTKAHGTVKMPSASDLYRAAAPGGLIYLAPGGTLRFETTGGTVTSLGVPFGAASTVQSVASGDSGFVVSSRTGGAKYQVFGAPGTFATLDTGSTQLVACQNVDASYAACNAGDADEENPREVDPSSSILVPLNGSAPTTSTDCPGGSTVVGSTLFWQCAGDDPKVFSLTAGASSTQSSSDDVEYRLVPAYDKAVGAQPGHGTIGAGGINIADSSIVGFDTTLAKTTVVAARPSPVTVAGFSLTAGRVVYNDDETVGSLPDSLTSTMSRPISATSTKVTVGTAQRLASGTSTSQLAPDVVAASGRTVVYGEGFTNRETTTLHVVTAGGSATITGVLGYGNIVLSGNRLVYSRQTSSGSTINLYDIRTKKTTVLRTVKGGIATASTAVWGNYVAWMTPHGWVYRENLTTGKTVKLATGNKKKYYGDVAVYAYGDWVGWHTQQYADVTGSDQDAIRNAKTMKPATKLNRTLWSLTSAGALLDSVATAKGGQGFGDLDAPTSFALRTYAGHTSTVLSSRSFVTGPQLDGNALAWVDSSGVLQAKPLSVSVPHPRSLGGSVGPAKFAATGTATWTLATPYSLGLTSCHVTITRHGATVRTLSCAKSSLASGVATVTWDGKTSQGVKAPAGTYHWSIHAAGKSGAATNSAGQSTPVTGTIALSH